MKQGRAHCAPSTGQSPSRTMTLQAFRSNEDVPRLEGRGRHRRKAYIRMGIVLGTVKSRNLKRAAFVASTRSGNAVCPAECNTPSGSTRMTHPLPINRELRAEPRKPVRLDVRVSARGDQPVSAIATNVSVRGFEIASRERLPPGRRCTVRFTLPLEGQPRRISLDASVVRSVADGDEFRAGLIVYGLPPATRELLECFVNC